MGSIFVIADQLIDGNKEQPVNHSGVLISNGRIDWIGKEESLPQDYDIEVKRYPGCTILPGLIDAHVHLSMMGTNDPWAEMIKDPVPMSTVKAVHNAEKTLRSGVTTVRDMGSKEGAVIKVAEAVEQGLVKGCQIQPAGRFIVMTGGHGYAIGLEVDGADEARKAARQELKSGAKVLKIMATGGVLTPGVEPGSPQLTVDEMKAITEEAHNAGRMVGAHAHGNKGIKNALLAKVDTIEHCSYLDNEALDLFHKNSAYMVSTLVATMKLIWNIDTAGLPAYVIEKITKHVDHEIASLEMAISAKIKIAAGTDSGSGVNPHNCLPEQLSLLVDHGMSAMESIQSGTKKSAEALGLLDELGTLDVGKRADILIVKGDPLRNIKMVADRVEVIKNGSFV